MQAPSTRRSWKAATAGLPIALLLTGLLRAAGAMPIDEVPSGTVLSKDNWEIAKGMLPDEVLDLYRKGEYANPIIKLEAVNRTVALPNLVAASEQNQLLPSECSAQLKDAGKCVPWTKGEGLVAWAPIQWALVPRRVWVVEAVPKNPYYLFGKQVFYIDQESGRGYWKQKYDWKGTALVNYAISQLPTTKVDGEPFHVRTGGGGNAGFSVNFKLDRATVTGMPVAATAYYIDIPDAMFETARIVRSGK